MARTEMGVLPGPARFTGTAADGTAAGDATPLTPTQLQKRGSTKYTLSILADPANTGKVYACLAPGAPSMSAAECKAIASIALVSGQQVSLEILAGGDILPLAFLAGDAAGQAYRAEIWSVVLE